MVCIMTTKLLKMFYVFHIIILYASNQLQEIEGAEMGLDNLLLEEEMFKTMKREIISREHKNYKRGAVVSKGPKKKEDEDEDDISAEDSKTNETINISNESDEGVEEAILARARGRGKFSFAAKPEVALGATEDDEEEFVDKILFSTTPSPSSSSKKIKIKGRSISIQNPINPHEKELRALIERFETPPHQLKPYLT